MQIYALCDALTIQKKSITIDNFIDLAYKHKAKIIQYRNKHDNLKKIKTDLLNLRKLWNRDLIINDYIELVPFCDGIHLGQEDLLYFNSDIKKAVLEVRNIIGNDKLLGISTHKKKEILQANKLNLDYIGLGAYRATKSKKTDIILGETLDELASLSKFPVAAIGGVRVDDDFKYVTYLAISRNLYEN